MNSYSDHWRVLPADSLSQRHSLAQQGYPRPHGPQLGREYPALTGAINPVMKPLHGIRCPTIINGLTTPSVPAHIKDLGTVRLSSTQRPTPGDQVSQGVTPRSLRPLSATTVTLPLCTWALFNEMK